MTWCPIHYALQHILVSYISNVYHSSVFFHRFFGLMPSLCSEDNVLATKLVSFYPNNKDVPTHNAVIAMFNASNGVPEVVGIKIQNKFIYITFL